MIRVLLLVAIVFSSASALSDPCGLAGKWKGGRGAIASFSLIEDGQHRIGGAYYASPDGTGVPYPLFGVYEPDTCTVGFCVAFDNGQSGNTHATSCWTGQKYDSHIRAFFTAATAMEEAHEAMAQYSMNSEEFVRFQ